VGEELLERATLGAPHQPVPGEQAIDVPHMLAVGELLVTELGAWRADAVLA
jgi:hypothetical protein